ncbi:hypothetical protein [Limnohabitans sp. Rim8]|uniref:hypothetical protein n=1 Tax=Limnohabitans sp. Rim8 TaxID=1100718 RepID=UPI0025EA3AA0|nr:hypothetical protein [Limnohabitans sp. Rim8]
MSLKPSCSLVFVLGALALLQGCASLLPSTTTNAAQFASFEEARMTIESLVPYQSDVTTLAPLGIDPLQQPNTLILTHSDIAKRVINGNLQNRDDLDKGIQDCLRAGDACWGWEIKASRIARVRTGSFFMDFVNLKRTTETSGWRFNATILMVNGLVVHRTWGGQPAVQEVEVRRNPLGPLQDGGPGFVQGLR